MECAINNRTVDRKLFGYRQNNNEVIATCCDRMITVWLFFSSHPLLLAAMYSVPTVRRLAHKKGKGLAGEHLGFLPWYLSLASSFLPSSTSKDTRKCIMILYNKECCSSQHMSTHTCTCQQTLRADTDTDTKKTHTRYTVLHTSLAPLGSGIPWWQTVRLFLTIDLRSLLCKVWFHSGEYEMGPGEGSWLGQGGTPYSGASYLRVTLGILPWHSFQPLRCLERPALGFLSLPPQDWCIPAGHRAWVVAPALPPPVLCDWRKEKAEKCSKGLWPRGAQCERWWWRRGCDAYLPLTHTAVIAQHFYNLMIHPTARGGCLADLSPRWDW